MDVIYSMFAAFEFDSRHRPGVYSNEKRISVVE